jgi:hypothetical protein
MRIIQLYPPRPRQATQAKTPQESKPGLGDLVERIVKPVAVALRMPCLDGQKKLRPESSCARRRDRLNKLGRKLGL